MKPKKKLFKDLRPLELFKIEPGIETNKDNSLYTYIFCALHPNPCIPEQYLAMNVSDGNLWIFDRLDVVRSLRQKLGLRSFGKHEKTIGQVTTVWISMDLFDNIVGK